MSTLPRPLCVSDQQLSQITSAAATLAPADRSRFLADLHGLLRHERELGDGAVDRAIRYAIRPLFRAPSSVFEPHSAKRSLGPQLEE